MIRRLVLAGAAGAVLTGGPVLAQERGGSSAWAIEATGATLGSLAGFGLGMALVDEDACGDDLGCIFSGLGTVLLVSSAGAVAGTWVAAEIGDTDVSLGGAALGSVAGAAAGLAFLKVLEEIEPGLDDGASAIVSFTISQGIVTALGSRIGAALR